MSTPWVTRAAEQPQIAVTMEQLRAAGEASGQHVLGPPLAADDTMPARFRTEAPA